MNKKFISLLIAICMLTASLPVLHSSASKPAVDLTQMTDILTTFGAYQNILSKNVNSVTRGDVVSAVVHLMGIENSNSDINFSDLSESHAQYSEFCTAYSLGIIRGDESGTVRPDDVVTYTEATFIILRAIGYGPLMDGGLTYGDALQKSKITKNINSDAPIGEICIQMLYNALFAPACVLTSVGANTEYTIDEDETILSVYRNIYYDEGTVTGNEHTLLDKSGAMPDGRVAIDSNTYYESDTSAAEYIGRSVFFWYEFSGNKRTLWYIDTHSDSGLIIKSEDILSFDDKIVTYSKDDKIEEAVLDVNVNVIYNGVAALPFTSDDILIKSGKLTLIDNDDNGKYDTVLSEEYDVFVVQSVNSEKEVIYGKFGAEALDLSDAESVSLTSRNGDSLEIKELTAWDVLCVYADKKSENYKIIYSPDEQAGKVTAMGDNGKLITIEGREYKVSDYYYSSSQKPIRMGEFGVYFLDVNDEVVAINDEYVLGDLNYGYAVAWKAGTGMSDRYISVKVFCETGEMKVFKLADKITIDGQTYKGYDELLMHFSQVGYPQPQLILYGLNDAGEINRADTKSPNVLNDEVALERYYTNYTYDDNENPIEGSTLTYRNTTNIFQGKVSMNSNTKVFLVPKDAASAPDDNFAIKKSSYFMNDQGYNFEAYKGYSQAHDADVIIIYTSGSGATSGLTDIAEEVSVIDEVSQAMNVDGVPSYKIKYWREGKYREDFVYEDSVVDNVLINGEKWVPHKGDIAQFEINSYNQITYIEPIYIAHKDKLLTSNPSATHVHHSPRFQLAYVYSKFGSNILITRSVLKKDEEYSFTVDDLESKAADLYKIYVYNREKDEIRTGTIEDLHAHLQTSLQKASKVFVDDRYGKPRTMMIIE